MAIRVLLLFAIVLVMPLLATPNVGDWLYPDGVSPLSTNTPSRSATGDPDGNRGLTGQSVQKPSATLAQRDRSGAPQVEFPQVEFPQVEFRDPESPDSVSSGPGPAESHPGEAPVLSVRGAEQVKRAVFENANQRARAADLPGDVASSRFRAIQQRLQQLGATYLLLESYGSDKLTYRFYCEMDAGGDRHSFESTDRDVLEAMERLLRQVEYWVSTSPRTDSIATRNP